MKKLGFLLIALGLGTAFVGCEPAKPKKEDKPATAPAGDPAKPEGDAPKDAK